MKAYSVVAVAAKSKSGWVGEIDFLTVVFSTHGSGFSCTSSLHRLELLALQGVSR
jgi:hypothetical protein